MIDEVEKNCRCNSLSAMSVHCLGKNAQAANNFSIVCKLKYWVKQTSESISRVRQKLNLAKGGFLDAESLLLPFPPFERYVGSSWYS